MKRYQLSLLICLCGVLAAVPATAKVRVLSGVRVNSFTEDLKDAEGVQTVIPLEIEYAGGKLTLLARSGYTQTALTRPQQDRAELSTVTDTLVSATYTLSTQPVTLIGGLRLNLPTGREHLDEAEAPITAGEFDLIRFGEGFNVSVNMSALKTFGPLTAGVNAAYSYRGDYTPTGKEDPFDPGDQFLLGGKFTWRAAPPLKLGISGTYLHATADQILDADDFQNGDLFLLGETVEYQPKPLDFALVIQQTLAQRAKYATDDGELNPEPAKGMGNTWTTSLIMGYKLSPALTVKLLGKVRLTAESPRQDAATGRPYAGRETEYSIGPDAWYQINRAWICRLGANYTAQTNERSATMKGDQTITGFNVSASVSVSF